MSATNEYRVLTQEPLLIVGVGNYIGTPPVKKREGCRLETESSKGGMELVDLRGVIAARSWNETDSRARLFHQLLDVRVDR
jgi:hypothetical protein